MGFNFPALERKQGLVTYFQDKIQKRKKVTLPKSSRSASPSDITLIIVFPEGIFEKG
jgi:hypothetical protein